MIHLDIPGRGVIELHHAVFDLNGTLATDGAFIPGVPDRLQQLGELLELHILTAGTHGNIAAFEQTLGRTFHLITHGDEDRQAYDLKSLWYAPLQDLDSIRYRQEMMQDLANRTLFDALQTFAKQMRTMRRFLLHMEKLVYPLQKQQWFLCAVELYGEAVQALSQQLSLCEVRSRGLREFRAYLRAYLASEPFTVLVAETRGLKADLATVTYTLLIKGSSITVRAYADEQDYSAVIDETFAKFKQGTVKDYRVKIAEQMEMNPIEARILELVARLHPAIFQHLDAYCLQHQAYLDRTIAAFDREIQFYLAYLEAIAPLQRAGLSFCFPHFSSMSKEITVVAGFDLVLAQKLVSEESAIVCNDVALHGQERVLVVTGPNQGGKTTFARMLGQVQYLASLGYPVPGREAQLVLCDQILTHFEKEETVTDLRGKLQDDLVRIDALLRQATSRSLLILNEIFISTTATDAAFLSRKILETILDLDAVCVCVTFLDELASLGEKTVSMVSTILPGNPASRTYRIVRKPADGLAYAVALAEKYRLTSQQIKERLPS